MNISTEHILQCNQSEPLADASGRIVDLMTENGLNHEYTVNETLNLQDGLGNHKVAIIVATHDVIYIQYNISSGLWVNHVILCRISTKISSIPLNISTLGQRILFAGIYHSLLLPIFNSYIGLHLEYYHTERFCNNEKHANTHWKTFSNALIC